MRVRDPPASRDHLSRETPSCFGGRGSFSNQGCILAESILAQQNLEVKFGDWENSQLIDRLNIVLNNPRIQLVIEKLETTRHTGGPGSPTLAAHCTWDSCEQLIWRVSPNVTCSEVECGGDDDDWNRVPLCAGYKAIKWGLWERIHTYRWAC